MKRLAGTATFSAPGPLAKLALAAVGVVVVAVGLILSVALVVLVPVAGAAAWGYLAWKRRALRRAVREEIGTRDAPPARRAPDRGRVFEGEAVVVPDERR